MQYVDMVIEAFDAELVSVSESEIPSEDIEEDVREGGKYFVQETEEGKILEGVGDVVEGVEDVLGVANFFHNDTIGVEDVVEGVEDVLEGAIEGVGDLAEGKGVVESVENAKGPFPSASESEALSEAVETLHSQKRRVVRFKVRVLSSPAGEMRPDEAVTIEYDDQQLQVVIQQLEARVLDPTGLIVLGRNLAEWLLPYERKGGVSARDLYKESLVLIDQKYGLRLRLLLHPQLETLPWEYLYIDQSDETESIDGFLALNPRISIVRSVGLPVQVPPSPIGGDIKVLAAFTSPINYSPLNLSAEKHDLQVALVNQPGISAVYLDNATMEMLDSALTRGAEIFHFVGHSTVVERTQLSPDIPKGGGYLVLQESNGNDSVLRAYLFSAPQLSSLLSSSHVQLVIFSAAEGGRHDNVEWSIIAHELLQAGIPAVVANQLSISGDGAIAFHRQFYHALAIGLSVEEAVSAGRIAAYNQAPDGREWGVASLYLETTHSQLFARPTDSDPRKTQSASDDYAIVIGINRYPALGDLQGAEKAARNFYDWLIAPDGGAVPANQVRLILISDYPPPARRQDARPRSQDIDDAFESMIDKGRQLGRMGRRLYIYMAGRSFSPTPVETALLMANASLVVMNHIPGRSYAQWFVDSGLFDEVILLMDCVRGDYQVVSISIPPWQPISAAPKAIAVQYFYAFATSEPERQEMPAIEGLFTLALLAGLNGSARDPQGRITGSSLRTFIYNYLPTLLGSGEYPSPMFELGGDREIVFADRVTPDETPEAERETAPIFDVTNAYALVIGINEYQSYPLQYAAKDALAIRDVLVDPQYCGYRPENVRLLLDEQATRAAIVQALTELTKRTNQDSTVFIFFSGHGYLYKPGEAYFLTTDGTADPQTGLSSTEFTAALDAVPARSIFVAIDTNYFGSVLQEKHGLAIFAAARQNENVRDGGDSGHSYFTYYLLSGLCGGVTSEDGFIRIFDLFEFLQPRVTASLKEQHPVLKVEAGDNFPIALSQGGQQNIPERYPDGFLYDAYISYVQSDADWLWKTLVPPLKASGLRIATSNDVEEEGINRLINAERGITRSRRTLIVLSENYLLNHAKDFEDSLSQTISKEESNRLLIVQIAPLDTRLLPNWLKGIFLVDLSNQAQNAGTLKRLAQILREPLSSRPDYKSYITEHTIDFTGRDWVFRAIDDWLARSDGSRFFLVTGEPGSGKTAIASRLCQFAQGVVSPPDGLTHVTSGFLSAIHFCSAQNAEWISPYAFARSLALQLTEHYPAYAFALTKIEVNLEVQEPQKGQVVGVSIGQIGLSMLSPEEDFRVLVLEPLAALFQNQPDLQVIILVDALDESLDYKGETNIVSLLALADNFPPGVRFLVTTRSTTEILSLLRSSRLEETSLSSGEGLIFSEADIRAYASHRLELVAEPERRQLADQVAGSARGSFLSARLALDTQIADYDRQQVLALIELIRADLLDLTVDALVHGVGLDLGRGGHLGVQLIQRGGSELAEQLQHERRLAPAEVLITDAGLLPTHYLLHVCDEDNLGRHSVQSVTQAVSSALATAESLSDVRSLAFPSLGTSAAGLDPTDTAPEILKAVVSHLTQNSHLQRVIFALNDEATYRAYVDAYRSLGGVVEEVRQAFNVYRLLISTKPDQVAVGQHVHLQVLLQPAPVSSRDEVVEVPTNVVEVYCSVSAEGLRVYGPDRAAIPIVPRIHELVFANFELEAHLPGQRSFTVELFIEDPQSGRLSISKTSKQVIVEFPTTDEERPPLLPALKVRVAPLPDFVLEVDANPTDTPFSSHHLTYRLTSRLPFLQLEHQKVGEVALRETDLVCIKTMIRQAVQQATNVQPEDSYEHMLSIGAYLFDRLFPADSAKDFRDMYWKVADRLTTWLIVEDGIVKDGVTWLPWELVVPYRAGAMAPPRFLGERYHLSRWIEGLGSSLGLYNEVPIGEVALAHYKIVERGQEDQDEELLGWQRLLKADPAYGIVQVVKPEIPVFGLHILRHADQVTSQDIAPRDGPAIAHSPEEEMPQVRLDLWFKRPVVTLGILTQVDNDLTNADVDNWPLPERARTFLRNGASAVVGPWWPTSEDADQVFWPAFYDLLARRVSLGEAVWRARLAVWGMLPHRPDWLAYALFGDPRARPYWPQPSEGYTALECLNPDESLLPNKTYYFRVSIRNRPPVWHKDRLVFAENLPQEPRAIFLAPGLQLATSEPIEMVPYGRTMVQATVAMRAREAGVFQITVRLLDGEERLQSLRLKLVVGETGTTGEELN